jgi:Eco57I restriction-modification methylase
LEDFGARNLHPSVLAIFDGTHGNAKRLLTEGGLSNYDDGAQPAIKITLPRGRGRRMPEFSRQDILVNSARALARARERAREQVFLHWEIAFPDIWDNWDSEQPVGGFDAIIGNPPWDRLKMQEVEWFAARRREIAMQQRASDRQRMIAELKRSGDPLAPITNAPGTPRKPRQRSHAHAGTIRCSPAATSTSTHCSSSAP